MCRYSSHVYKPHYACFNCRKAFKRPLLSDAGRHQSVTGRWYAEQAGKVAQGWGVEEQSAATCPDCGEPMADMGLDFKAPIRANHKAWQHLRALYTVGITFHSCGCGGHGYVPATIDALSSYLASRQADYVRELQFWLNRSVPTTETERQENLSHNRGLPMSKRGYIEPAAAIAYWQQRVQAVTAQLKKLLCNDKTSAFK
jgi:hypothetical protein